MPLYRSTRRALTVVPALGVIALTAGVASAQASNPSAHRYERQQATANADSTFVGKVEVVQGAAASGDTLTGRVFVDSARNSRFDDSDEGVAGVKVSNGRDVVVTDEEGRYRLPAFENMTVTVSQPAGYQVPVDKHNVAQFHYNHLPKGTPQKLRFGGIAPTGALPSAVNFPLTRSAASAQDQQQCVIAGDLQTYSRREIGYARDGAMKDVADRGRLSACGMLFIGDVAGDDLGLYPEMKSLFKAVDGPVRFLPGNHDLDLDATDPQHSHDTFRAQMGPEYYSYDVGKTHVIALNDVRYPCDAKVDNADGRRPQCAGERPAYNGRLDDDQLAWLKNDLARTPKDRLVVIASHIPFLTYADMESPIHQLDQVKEVYQLLQGRPAVHVSGHTHSIENLKKGDSYGPWKQVMGVDALPFPHLVAGAISGDWYSGDLDDRGVPMAYQRDGGKPGLVTLDVTGTSFAERFTVRGEDDAQQLNVGVNSPHWRSWFTALDTWRKEHPNDETRQTPPLNANDLGDPHLVTTDDLAKGTWLTTNFWMGATDAKVTVRLDGGDARAAQRTQPAKGEGQLSGAAYADPVAATRQLSVGRTAQESTSGDADAQGYRLYNGSQFGPGPARPGNNVADRMHHLWRFDLPENLEPGVHHASIEATDSHGRTFTESLSFTVASKREPVEFRTGLFPARD